MASPSSGTPFHSLQATSHALQPMQTEVSVKKPWRGGGSAQPASAAGSGSGPDRELLIGALLLAGGTWRALLVTSLHRDARPPPVVLDQAQQRRPGRPAARLDVAGGDLGLLDVHVGGQGHGE